MRCESKGPKGLAAWMLFVGGVEEFTIRYQIVSAWKQVENHNSFCADVKLRVAHSNHIRNLICFTWVNRNLVNWNLDRIEKKPFADLGHCGAVECDPLYGCKRWGSDEDSLDLDDDQRIDIDELMEREREKKKKLSVCWLFVIRLTLEYGHELTIEWESCTAILLETRWVSQIDFRMVTNHMDKAPAPVEMFKSLINAIWKPHRLVQDLFLLWCNLWAFWMQHISTIDQMHRQGTEPA